MCEYCRTCVGVCGDIEADKPKDIFCEGTDAFSISASVLVDTLCIYVESSVEKTTDDNFLRANAEIVTAPDINYCPMCGRQLRNKLIPFTEVEECSTR